MAERHFDISLRQLKERLVSMAGLVEQAIDAATQGLKSRDKTKINYVFEIEQKVNEAHKSIDEACVNLLALQQPLAADLRMIIAVIKINTDLERMGDQAVNIAQNSTHYLSREPLKPLIDLPLMADETKIMVKEAIDAFVRTDVKKARETLVRDDQVDAFKSKIFKDVLEHLKSQPTMIEQGFALILIARNLERIGDHATNIAEDVIFAATGEDVRHTPHLEAMKNVLNAK